MQAIKIIYNRLKYWFVAASMMYNDVVRIRNKLKS